MAIGKTNAQRKILLTTRSTTPTKSQQTVQTPEGYDGLISVTVNAIPSNYIDTSDATATENSILSGETAYVDGSLIIGTIATKTSSNLTASGKTVTVPAGYYASAAKKSVSTATQATPTISVSNSGIITASSTQSAGYVSSGTKSATYTLSSSDDSDFIASNIKNGVTIFGVEGNYIGGGKGYANEAQSIWGGSSYEIKCTSQPKLCFVIDKLGPMHTSLQVLWAYYDFTNGIGQACLFNNGSYFGVYSAYASWDGSSIYISCSEGGGNFLQNRFYCYGYAT